MNRSRPPCNNICKFQVMATHGLHIHRKIPFLFLYSSEMCPPGQHILIWVQSIVPFTTGRPPICLASGGSLGVGKWMNCWWWAAMALAILPTIRLTDDCEICSKSHAMLWKLPVEKNRKLVNSCSIGGMLDALSKNVLKSSLIISKILLTVSFESLNLAWNSWSSRCSNGFDQSLKVMPVPRNVFNLFLSSQIIHFQIKNIIQKFSSWARGRCHPNSTVTQFLKLVRIWVRVVHTDLDRYSLIWMSSWIISMSLSGVYVECGLRIWP